MLETHGLTRLEILCALYYGARPLGMGMLHYVPGGLTIKEALAILEQSQGYFDYLQGRVMKISLNNLDPGLYDRDNGPGAAQRAIDNYYTTPEDQRHVFHEHD